MRPRSSGKVQAIWNSPAFGLLGIGSYLAVSIVGLTLIGVYLDAQFGTKPILTLVFLVLGLVVGFYGAYRQLRDVLERTRQQAEHGGDEDGGGKGR